jgi:sigma-54-specific transcriptional regulator
MSEHHPAKLLTFPPVGESPSTPGAKELLCSDPRSQLILQQLDRVAPTDATVLIAGETGTGKEMAARYIHERSHSHGPFVAVNCGAFGESLVEAELFGHEAGAFTGAQQARAGWFEAAHGGTLFLDEIGDMPLYLQVRLLRVLQERQVVRLGSRKPIAINVRLIAATNIDLDQAVESRQFRRDLYYRLNVAAVKLLPLRERRGDILPLAQHLIERYRHKLGLEQGALTSCAEEALLTYDWPGNIRELENVIHIGLIMSHNGVIDLADLKLPHRKERFADAALGSERGESDELDMLGQGLRRLLDSDREDVYQEVERLLLTTAFEHCAGNQVRTAKRLGVSRNVVRAQLKRFGLLGVEHAPLEGHAVAPPNPHRYGNLVGTG